MSCSIVEDIENKSSSVFSTTTDDTGVDLLSIATTPIKVSQEEGWITRSVTSKAVASSLSHSEDFLSLNDAPPLPPRPCTNRITSKLEPIRVNQPPRHKSFRFPFNQARSQSISKLDNNKLERKNGYQSSYNSLGNVNDIPFQHQNHKELIFDEKLGFQLSDASHSNRKNSKLKKLSSSVNKFFRNKFFFASVRSSVPSPLDLNLRSTFSEFSRENSPERRRNKSDDRRASRSGLFSSLTQTKSKSTRGLPSFIFNSPSFCHSPEDHKEPRTAPSSPNDPGRCYRNCGSITSGTNVQHHVHHHVYHVHHIHHYRNGKDKTGEQDNTKAMQNETERVSHFYDDDQGDKDNLATNNDSAPNKETHVYNTYQTTLEGDPSRTLCNKQKDNDEDQSSLNNLTSIKLEKNPELDSFKVSMKQLRTCGWYWGPLRFQEAEHLLSDQPNGTFLVRDSGHEKNILSLSFKVDDSIFHTRIEHKNGRFSFTSQADSHSSPSIIDFIHGAVEHSQSGKYHYFLQSSEAGRPPVEVPLLYPVSRHQTIQSLRQICRFKIITCLLPIVDDGDNGPHLESLVKELPIPRDLKDYLLHPQYFFDNLAEIKGQLAKKEPMLISTMEPFRQRNQSSCLSTSHNQHGPVITPITRRSRLLSSRPQAPSLHLEIQDSNNALGNNNFSLSRISLSS